MDKSKVIETFLALGELEARAETVTRLCFNVYVKYFDRFGFPNSDIRDDSTFRVEWHQGDCDCMEDIPVKYLWMTEEEIKQDMEQRAQADEERKRIQHIESAEQRIREYQYKLKMEQENLAKMKA